MKISAAVFNRISSNAKVMPTACEGRGLTYKAIKGASLCNVPNAFKYGPR